MKTLVIVLAVISFHSCKSDGIDPNGLIGTWNPSYETRTKDSNGNYGEWLTINTLVALPAISFTEDGRLLYLQGDKAVEGCCQFRKYTRDGTTITLSDLVPCPAVKCAICLDWQIIRLDEQTLELEICEDVQNRYYRQGYNTK